MSDAGQVHSRGCGRPRLFHGDAAINRSIPGRLCENKIGAKRGSLRVVVYITVAALSSESEFWRS